jgi:hypothetical protein
VVKLLSWLREDEMVTELCVYLAVDSRKLPIFHGKGALRSPMDRDEQRKHFVLHLVKRLREAGYRFYRVRPEGLPASKM